VEVVQLLVIQESQEDLVVEVHPPQLALATAQQRYLDKVILEEVHLEVVQAASVLLEVLLVLVELIQIFLQT
jgi:phosphoribosylaminoimidazole carboxylase (NCAIR synthetase)